jgi:hypothetical protein
MRKLFTPIVAGVVALGLAAPSQAAQKHREVVERIDEDGGFSIDCGEFGPYDFDNIVAGHQWVTITEVRDGEGTLLQTVFHTGIKETDTNSVTGGSLPLTTAIREVWDYEDNTRTQTGKVFLGTEGQGGTYVHETGKIVMTLDTHEAFFVAGPHSAFFEGGVDYPVCRALAEV